MGSSRTGMILIGYQGIGKTTMCKKHKSCIDLDSSLFKFDSTLRRDPRWYVTYCRYAVELAKQGYIVCVSSHSTVRNYLHEMRNSKETVESSHKSDQMNNYPLVGICTPSGNLQKVWIKKLRKRFKHDPSYKNYKAYLDAYNFYELKTDELAKDRRFDFIITINEPSYNLYKFVKKMRKCLMVL